MMKLNIRPGAILFSILAAALAWKAALLGLDCLPFNADEAVVALMARHILQGERPIFFYGQAYMGSLDAYLVAGFFSLLGQQVWVIRFVQALLYTGTIISTIGLGRAIYGASRTGLWAGVLLAIPTVNVTLYTTASLGGYGEALLIGNLILLTSLRIVNDMQRVSQGPNHWLLWAGLGLLAGVGLWANGLTLIYTIPAGGMLLIMIFRYRKSLSRRTIWGGLLAGLAGFGVGSSPWWIYAFTQGWQALFLELGGNAVAVEQGSWLARTGSHLVNLVLLGGTVLLGFRPPWEVRWLGLPLLPFVLIFWVLAIWLGIRRLKRDSSMRVGGLLLAGMAGTLAAGFLFTSFGADPSGRYFVPLAIPLSLAAADAVQQISIRLRWQAALLGLVLIFQAWGTIESALRTPPGITTQFDVSTQIDERYRPELIRFLKAQGETRGYSSYWVAYPTTFLSEEKIILVPRLPYHADLRYTARDDRYPPYDQAVLQSDRVVYITALNPELDKKMVLGFGSNGVAWQEQQIGDYRVYYHLSKTVHPDDLGLGEFD